MTQSESASVDRDLLAAVLDRLIPAGGGLPGGGAVAVDHVLRAMRQADLAALLAAVEQAPHSSDGFTALPPAERDALLQRVEAAQPAAFERLVVQAYCGYYSDPAVLQGLGLDPRPPQPRGHLLEPFDPSLLERVRQRPPIYRQA